MKCPSCGKRIIARVRFCKHCGTPVTRPNRKAISIRSVVSRLTQRQLRIIRVAGVLILVVLLLIAFWAVGKRRHAVKPELSGDEIFVEKSKSAKEMAPDAVHGKVIAVNMRDERRGALTVISLHTGKVYTFTVGWRTSCHPRRYPSVGEKAKIYYLSGKGMREATQIKIDPATTTPGSP